MIDNYNTMNMQYEFGGYRYPYLDINDPYTLNDEFITDYPGDYGLEKRNVFWDDLEKILHKYLKDSIIRLGHLIEKHPIESISFAHYMLGERGMDANIDKANVGRKNVVIGIMPDMIIEFLNRHWYPNTYPILKELNFDHELVHGMDELMRQYLSLSYKNIQPVEYLFSYLITYRTEGLASLTSFLRGIDGEKSMRKAKKSFRESLIGIVNKNTDSDNDWVELWKLMERDNRKPYSIGPMMMLHAINVKAYNEKDKGIAELADRAINMEKLENEEINKLIDMGLAIDLPAYILSLCQSGNGKEAFIEKELVINVFKKLHISSFQIKYGDQYYNDYESLVAHLKKGYFLKLIPGADNVFEFAGADEFHEYDRQMECNQKFREFADKTLDLLSN